MDDSFKRMCSILADALFHPFRVLKMVNEYNVRMFFNLCRMNGLKDAIMNMGNALEASGYDPDCTDINSFVQKYMYSEKILNVPVFEEPFVSVIIPVYNQFKLTYSCIHSIIDTVQGIPYEIIIADDCSTDETKHIEDHITGIRVIHNPENLRFTLNCNNAVKEAHGKYVVLLNNDTVVCDGWLDSLMDVLENHPDIGMAGSKFIYPDGRLQEAGGIIWSDGNAWNYGRGKNPSNPEFNYVKDVDYISGASLIISKALWDEIGGFDERFAPSYCEDSDLAFEVRRHGSRVVYTPFSEVIHFEGASNGKSSASGLKANQVTNKEKFYQKWKQTLEQDGNIGSKDVFFARDRSFGKPVVLIIDAQIPRFDADAGSRTSDMYIRMFLKMGFNVKLIGANYCYEKKYINHYQRMGVEVLYGEDMRMNWKNWIHAHTSYLDYVLIFHPQVAEVYLPFIRAHTSAKILYNMCDLHYRRLMRQSEFRDDPRVKAEAERMQELEYRVMDLSDSILSVNNEETDIVNRDVQGNKAITVPAYCYPSIERTDYSAKNRHGMLFVGGFGHVPNIDSVIWFVKHVMPLVRKGDPDCKLYIVGSNPTDEILALGSDSVHIESNVSDDRLDELYNTCAVSVIPLQYGAGVKGKTVEAMYHCIPIVSTGIGTEGICGADSFIPSCDSPEDFAAEILRIRRDPDYAASMVSQYPLCLERNFSEQCLRECFEYLFS